MVIMLKYCCCGCKLKTGTVILGALDVVSANLPSTFLTVYRNGSSFSQEKETLKLIKLCFTRVAKILAISIQITFEQSTAVSAHGLKVSERKHECQKRIKLRKFL